MKKRILLILVLSLCVMIFSGCEVTIDGFGGLTDLGDRFDSTLSASGDLYEQGFITENEYTSITNNIEALRKVLNKIDDTKTLDISSEDDAITKVTNLIKSGDVNLMYNCSAIRCLGDGVCGYTEDTKAQVSLSDFIVESIWGMPTNGGKDRAWNWILKEDTYRESISNAGISPLPYQIGGYRVVEDGMGYLTAYDRAEDPIAFEPLTIVPNSVPDTINSILDFPIYVLRPDTQEQLGSTSIDDLHNYIKQCFYDGTTLKADIADLKLSRYFYPVKIQSGDSAGKELTLRFLVEKSGIMSYWNNILRTSTWNTSKDNEQGKDIIITQEVKIKTGWSHESILAIRVREYNKNSIDNLAKALGLFNSDGNNGRYIVSKDSTGYGNKIYLVEYPVYAISGFEAINVNGQEMVRAQFAEAGIGINIISGKIIKYNPLGEGKYSTQGVYITDSDNYYTSAIFGDASGKASFAILGYAENIKLDLTSLKEKYGDTATNLGTYNITTARIILNDYIEATYAPGYSSESKLVAFGRKIRIDIKDNVITRAPKSGYGDPVFTEINANTVNIRGEMADYVEHPSSIDYHRVHQKELVFDTSEEMATYVDKDGNTKVKKLKIYDFCDIDALIGKGCASVIADKEYEKFKAEKFNNMTAEEKEEYDKLTDEKKAEIERVERQSFTKDIVISIVANNNVPEDVPAKDDYFSKQPEPKELRNITINSTSEYTSIAASVLFPGPSIGIEDYKNNVNYINHLPNQQRFWVMTVRGGIFDSGLFYSWIGSTSDKASLIWWNKYLGDNGFQYKVSLEDTNTYLLSNYRTQVQQAGVVLIDLDTIQKLTEMYEKEDDAARVKTIRTTFVVIGWGMMASSLVLLVLWAIDTNTDLGLDLLGKATFGHWTAVKYEADIPNTDNSNMYITGGKMLTKCLIIIAAGIILIQIDVMDTVSMIIRLFGRVAQEVEKVIKGI